MDLQTLFYVVGIVFMLTVLTIVVGVGVTLYIIRKRLMQITKLASRPAETAAMMGAGLVEGLATKFKDWTAPKKVK